MPEPTVSTRESLRLLPQPGEHPRLGDEHGVDAEPQLLRDDTRLHAVENDALERPPGRRREIRSDLGHENVQHVTIVLLVPAATQPALRISALLQQRIAARRQA